MLQSRTARIFWFAFIGLSIIWVISWLYLKKSPHTRIMKQKGVEVSNNTVAITAKLTYGDTLPNFYFPLGSRGYLGREDCIGKVTLFLFLHPRNLNYSKLFDHLDKIFLNSIHSMRIVIVLRGKLEAESLKERQRFPFLLLIDEKNRLWDSFGIPHNACSYVIVSDKKGIIRLALPAIDAGALKIIVERYL